MARVLVCILTLFVVASASQDPPPGSPQPPRDRARPGATASISGRVLAAEDAAPIRWATVTLTPPAATRPLRTTTNDSGRYRFHGLAPGTYRASARKAGFISQRFGTSTTSESSRPIELGNGHTFTADFILSRGGAIEGTIVNDSGEPVQFVTVRARRLVYTAAGRNTAAAGSIARTDDRGRFRVHSLPPGAYFVAADRTIALPIRPGSEEAIQRPAGFALTFYPGTPRLDEAKRVAVETGGTVEAGFALARVSGTSAVTTRVIDSQGRVPSNAGLIYIYLTGIVWRGTANAPGRNEFRHVDIPPGDYWVVASARSPGADPEFAATRLALYGQDVPDLTIQTATGATVEGRIELDGERPGDFSRLEVVAHNTLFPAIVGDPNLPRSPARVAPDGRFTFKNLFGPRLFRINRLPESWVVKAIALDGVDVGETSIDFRGGGGARRLRIVLSDQSGEVSGVVTGDGTRAAGARVVVFAEDEGRWGFQSRYVHVADAGSDGRFVIGRLLPGRYLACALADIEEGSWADTEVLRQLRPSATPFSVAGRERVALTLKVMP
jgi:hypothetical protein